MGLALRSDLIAIELLRPFAERSDTLCFEGRYVTIVIDDEEVTGLLDAVFVGVRVLASRLFVSRSPMSSKAQG